MVLARFFLCLKPDFDFNLGSDSDSDSDSDTEFDPDSDYGSSSGSCSDLTSVPHAADGLADSRCGSTMFTPTDFELRVTSY